MRITEEQYSAIKAKRKPASAINRVSHKFNAKRQELDGINFDSKLEASYYLKLKHLVQAGQVVFFLRQVPFQLPGNTKYVVDFQEFHADGTVVFTDVKGMETSEFKMKKKQVEDLYPITLNIVKKGDF